MRNTERFNRLALWGITPFSLADGFQRLRNTLPAPSVKIPFLLYRWSALWQPRLFFVDTQCTNVMLLFALLGISLYRRSFIMPSCKVTRHIIWLVSNWRAPTMSFRLFFSVSPGQGCGNNRVWNLCYCAVHVGNIRCLSHGMINPLKTKRKLLYLKTQSVPRCKHFISVIKTYQFML